MKISSYILIVCMIEYVLRDVACFKISNNLNISTNLKLKMHLEMMRKIKKQKNQLFNDLYHSSNFVNNNNQKPDESLDYENIQSKIFIVSILNKLHNNVKIKCL